MAAETKKSYKVTREFTDPQGKTWKAGENYPAPASGSPGAQNLQAAISAGQVQEQSAEDE